MSVYGAYRLAIQWAECFNKAFFVIEIGPGLYGVTAKLSKQDKVIGRCHA